MSKNISRMEQNAKINNVSVEQLKESRLLSLDIDVYKEYLNNRELLLTDEELEEYKELDSKHDDFNYEKYIKIKKSKKSKELKKDSNDLDNREKIEKFLKLKVEDKEEIEKFNLYLKKEHLDKLITVSEITNMSVRNVVSHILDLHLEKIDIDKEKVAQYRQRTKSRRKKNS